MTELPGRTIGRDPRPRDLEPLYDVETLIRAMLQIVAAMRSAVVVVAGEGSERPRLQHLAAPPCAARGHSAAVTFLDQQGRVRAAVHGPEASYRPAGDEGFIRVEARDRAGGRVWSQPFWIEKEGRGA